MNSRIFKWLVSFAAFFCLILVVSTATAKKPVKPPPEPEPGGNGAACMDTELFPAFVWEKSKMQEFFLSNAEGDCSISVYLGNEYEGTSSFSYRFFGDMESGNGTGKIVWSQRMEIPKSFYFYPAEIMLLEFEVENREITTPLPLVPRVLMVAPEEMGNVFRPDLSPSGDRVIVSAYTPREIIGYIWEFEIPDPESGPVEEWDVLFTQEADEELGLAVGTLHYPHYGLDDQRNRIYFGFDYPDHKLAYIEQNPSTGVWSKEATLITELEKGIGPRAIGLWGFGDGVKEVIASSRYIDGSRIIGVFDIDACASTVPPGVGDDCIIADGIEGWIHGISFTTHTEGPLPALLYIYDVDVKKVGYEIRECDLTLPGDLCYRTVIEGIVNRTRTVYSVDSAD